MYKQIFNPDNIYVWNFEEKRIFWICIDINILFEYALYVIKRKHPKLWFKLNVNNIHKNKKFYHYSKKENINLNLDDLNKQNLMKLERDFERQNKEI